MGFRNKKNRVHPSGNKKKQQRKERKRRRLARLVQTIIPFSCCIGEGVLKDGAYQEPTTIDNNCKENQLTESSRRLHRPLPPLRGFHSSKAAAPPITHEHANINRCTKVGESPAYPSQRALTTVTLSPSNSRLSLTPSVGSDSSSDEDDDSLYPPKSHSKYFLPVEATSSMANYSGFKECGSRPAPPQIHQSQAAKSFTLTNYQPTSIGIQEDLMSRVTSFPSINSPLHQRLPYCRMVQKALAFLSDSDEPCDSTQTVAGKESESSDDFDDCFEPMAGLHQPRDNKEVKSLKFNPGTHQKQTDISDELTYYDAQEEQIYEEEPCTSPEKDVEYFPGEEDTFLPLIETSLRCIRGWLLPSNIHQRAVQPEPPFVLDDDDQPIMSSTINHALLVISYYTSNLQSGLWLRGKQCPHFLEGMFRSVIKNGNTVHLENYDFEHKVSAIEALTLLRTKYDAWGLQWDTESALIQKPEETKLAEEGHSTELPMDIYCPPSNQRSLAYHVSKLDVDAREALMYTFKGDSMVFVPTGDGRVLLMDQHAHDDMDGGAIIAVCPNSIVPIQDMLNDYHLEYHESNDREGSGVKFSYISL